LPCRLASILSKQNLAPSKLDEIKVKANIIKAFTEEKLTQVDEELESIAHKDTAEL
jgi:protein disulfide-isomerase A6